MKLELAGAAPCVFTRRLWLYLFLSGLVGLPNEMISSLVDLQSTILGVFLTCSGNFMHL